jgi:predicted DNA-binding transcriptional regulator AlpA
MARVHNLAGAPVGVPTLDELADDPARARDLPLETLQTLAWRCLTALTAVHVATTPSTSPNATARTRGDDGERLLTVQEVAVRIGMSVSWVEKHTADLPARVSVAGNPRWRKSDLERWMKNRPEYGAPPP